MARRRRRGGGDKPKPTQLKILDGSAKKNPQYINKREPAASTAAPECPDYLDPVARQEWEHLSHWLNEMGMLSETYTRAMAAYCESYSHYRKTLEIVQQTGIALVQQNDDGTTKVSRNPFVTELHKFKDECYRYLTEFGLTPSAKSRIVMDEKQNDVSRFFG